MDLLYSQLQKIWKYQKHIGLEAKKLDPSLNQIIAGFPLPEVQTMTTSVGVSFYRLERGDGKGNNEEVRNRLKKRACCGLPTKPNAWR